ncbi:MAG: VOC family protein [Dehalococcoidia bacterium]|nr:VOC family protein [Dehalococcoidia bacterium]
MIKGLESVTLFSENAKRLAEFYQEKVGLVLTMEEQMGENNEHLYAFEFSEGGMLAVMDHSGVKGRNQEPDRIIFNLKVADIDQEVKTLDNRGVKKVQDTYPVEGYGVIATFEDVDGNYFQLVQLKES